MKRFTFPLERVLGWRIMQARIERLRWEQIRAERHAIDRQSEQLSAERTRSAAEIHKARTATGAELAALDRFRRHSDMLRARLGEKRAECEKRLAEQARALAAKEREVKILEHLRERKVAAWQAEADREVEQVAAEAFLSRWHWRASSRLE